MATIPPLDPFDEDGWTAFEMLVSERHKIVMRALQRISRRLAALEKSISQSEEGSGEVGESNAL